MSEKTYQIVRFFQRKHREVITHGLTLEQARAHCSDPETSSRTATSDSAKLITSRFGPWFDGYETEEVSE